MLRVHQGGLGSPWSTWSTLIHSVLYILKFYRQCGPRWIRVDLEDQGDHNPFWWPRTGFYTLLMLFFGYHICKGLTVETLGRTSFTVKCDLFVISINCGIVFS